MASPSHRDNLLSTKYREIGIAVVEGDMDGVDTTIIVQLFGTRYADSLPSVPIASAETADASSIKVSPQPTIAPTVAPTPTEVPVVASDDFTEETTAGIVAQENPPTRLLVSPFSTTKGLSVVTVFLLFGVLVVDVVATRRRRIARMGGRTFAHLAFLGMIMAIAIIMRAGSIL
jgi:hypothetical protein